MVEATRIIERSRDELRRQEAARAAWLYFVRGRTQDEIAAQLDVSRQAAQRLVAYAVSEKLIHFRLDHPIEACVALGDALARRHGLAFCDVAPTDAAAPDAVDGVAQLVADRLYKVLSRKEPTVLAFGTGRTMRAAVERMAPLHRPQHKLLSLVGAMSSIGRASSYDVVMRLGDRVGAERFPMPCPVIADTPAEREAVQAQRAFSGIREMRAKAAAVFMGVAEIGRNAPLHEDGFVTDADIASLTAQGAVAELVGWPINRKGALIACELSERVASLPLEVPPRRLTVIAGAGERKIEPIRAVLTGGLATALVTDERTAQALLRG